MQTNPTKISPQQLVADYGDRVFAIVRRMVQNREDAEEVTQDVFLKLFKKIATFEGRSSLSTWIFRVAYNAALDFLRRHKDFSAEWSDNFELPDSSGYDFQHEQELNDLERAIEQLNPRDALLVELHYWQRLKVEEIAQVVGLTPENVKTRLYRIRQRLAEIIKQNNSGNDGR